VGSSFGRMNNEDGKNINIVWCSSSLKSVIWLLQNKTTNKTTYDGTLSNYLGQVIINILSS
jgi:hypothetical protein